MTARLTALLVFALAAVLHAAESRSDLEEQLAKEQARLASMEAQLKKEQQRAIAPAPEPALEAKPKAAEPKPAEATPDAALIAHPNLAAADTLYGLGRYLEAAPVYEAAAKGAAGNAIDRIWALLQAGNCARRLGHFDAAVAFFQRIMAEYPEPPWFKDQVAWALRTAQWQKRMHLRTLGAGD